MSDSPAKTRPSEKERFLAALAYIGFLFLVPMFAGRGSEFAKFHTRQGIVMFAAHVVASALTWIPLVGWLFPIAAIVVAIAGSVQALRGEYWELPYIGKHAKKLNI